MWLLRQSCLFILAIVAMALTPAVAADSARDISHLVNIEYGGFRIDHATGELVQRLRLRNVSQSTVAGKLALSIQGLSPQARVANADGKLSSNAVDRKTASTAAAVPVVREALSPGQTTDVIIRFDNPSQQPIRYEAFVYQVTP